MAMVRDTYHRPLAERAISNAMAPSTTMTTHSHGCALSLPSLPNLSKTPKFQALTPLPRNRSFRSPRLKSSRQTRRPFAISAALPPLDLTEDNIRQVLVDARSEFGQLFDTSVGMTGEVDLAELDGPFVKIRLKGRFWHKRTTVLDRISNYLKNRIPEILEVDIEDEKQLDDSPENF